MWSPSCLLRATTLICVLSGHYPQRTRSNKRLVCLDHTFRQVLTSSIPVSVTPSILLQTHLEFFGWSLTLKVAVDAWSFRNGQITDHNGFSV